MCLNKPITIPVGADGKSCTVAYASDSSGTGFSYTPAEGLDYMSIVCKVGSISSTDFTSWSQYLGTNGTNGTNGTSVTSAALSDGKTPIGGTVYTSGTLVIGLSDGSYINAGIIDCCTLNWIEFEPANGWAGKADAIGGVESLYYAIDTQGLVHFRGMMDNALATNANFMTDLLGGNDTVQSFCANWAVAAATPIMSSLTLTPTSGAWLWQYADSQFWNLATIPPMYLP
jgi:hypothetical protein